MLLALSNSRDETTNYLLRRLRATDVPHVRLDSDNLHEHIRVLHDTRGTTLSVGAESYFPQQFSHVWLRRPEKLKVSASDDEAEQAYARREWTAALEGFLAQIPPECWINHPTANTQAAHKLEQIQRARAFGLPTPESLVTQDCSAARAFLNRHRARGLIAKPLSTGYVERSDRNDTLVYTSAVSEEDLTNADSLRLCPTLFQERIGKRCDVRITALDNHFVAVSIDRRDSSGAHVLDVRTDNMAGARYSVIQIPVEVEARLASVLKSYGLRFAAVDFIIDNKGQWIFLEINPNGQWAWLDIVGPTEIWRLFVDTFRRPKGSEITPLGPIDSATWLALRMCRLPTTREHVRLKSYDHQPPFVSQIRPSEARSNKDLLDYAISTFERANDRRKSVDEKAKFLAGLVTLGITATIALGPRIVYSGAAVVPALLFVVSLLLLVAYFRLIVAAQPSVTAEDVLQTDDELMRQLIADYLSSADHNERRTSYSADIFRAAMTFFLAGVMTAVLLAVVVTVAP